MKHDRPKSNPPGRPIEAGYWDRAQRPLTCLIFLLPLIVAYEVGTLIYATDAASGITHYIYARSLLQDFFDVIGVSGYYLPGLIVVVVLLVWHVTRRDPWRLEPGTYVGMTAESFALAAPPFVFMILLARQAPEAFMLAEFAGGDAAATSWQSRLVFSIGAGIYEELLFRLILIALIHLVLVDVLRMSHAWGAGLAVGLSAVAFALYHFSSFEEVRLGLFTFYTIAGVYLAAVYVLRGFGVVVGTHAMYDVFVVVLHESQK